MTKRAFTEVTFDASPSEVSNALVQIMWASRIRVKNQTMSEKPLTICLYGEHSVSFRSWGESLKIIIAENNGGSKVNAESEAKVSTTIFDYGQNKENLEILMNQLIMRFRQTSSLEIKEAVL
jgi:hypothetical protein